MSQREVADVLGVDQATVNRDANASKPSQQEAETQEDSDSTDADASQQEAEPDSPPKPRMSMRLGWKFVVDACVGKLRRLFPWFRFGTTAKRPLVQPDCLLLQLDELCPKVCPNRKLSDSALT